MAGLRRFGGAREGSSLPASPPSEIETLDVTIAGLADLDANQLRVQWRNHLGGSALAHLPRWLLLRLLAYRIQAAALGDLDKATRRLFRSSNVEGAGSHGASFETRSPATRDGVSLKPGALLVREWKGKLERVVVWENRFAWNGETYRSLSQIAKAITGTNWNGHRFFGLQSARPQSKGGNASRPRAPQDAKLCRSERGVDSHAVAEREIRLAQAGDGP